MSKQDEYRGTTRTLDVLRSLNENNGSTITQISQAIGISRTALYRIIGALQDSGYVRRRKDDGAYFLTSLVRTLTDGFRDEYGIADVAGPVLDDLQRKVVWPTDLGTCRNYSIQLTSTTRRHSPLVIDRGLVGSEMPLLRTALGLAYIAHCPPAERKRIVAHLAANSQSWDSVVARDKAELARALRDVRSKGYAHRYRDFFAGRKFPDLIAENGTIAVPIRVGGYSVASLGITFIANALTVAEAASRHLKDLTDAASTIEELLTRRPQADVPPAAA